MSGLTWVVTTDDGIAVCYCDTHSAATATARALGAGYRVERV